MTQTLIALSYWLHSLATVVLIGHYLLLAILYLPAMRKTSLEVIGPILSDISRHSRRWMYASLIVFTLTGIYLMFLDPNYFGVGDFRNFWSIMMLVKHILIVGMIAAGFWFNAFLRVGPMLSSRNSAEQAFARFRLFVNIMAVSGVIVLLLTALAQIQ
ncbi:MAG TPA: hypothetical protein VHO49_08640 [Anaerolineales bacterium]|nr:hypothetical protein [Anaerolineales bacterium]